MNEQEQKQPKDNEDQYNVNHYLIPSRKKLYRSPYNSILLGISGGIAEYMNVNPLLVRALFVITAVLGGWGIIAYVICAFLIPEHPSEKAKGRFSRIRSSKILGVVLIGIGIYFYLPTFGIFRVFSLFSFSSSLFFALSLILIGVYFLLNRNEILAADFVGNPNQFYRAKKHRRLLGVCEGFSIYSGMDVNIIRMSWVLLTFFTLGIAALFYIIVGYFIPNEVSEVTENE